MGDSVWDIEAARAAGLASLAVESGGFSRHELAEKGATYGYRDVTEILDQFDRYAWPVAAVIVRS